MRNYFMRISARLPGVYERATYPCDCSESERESFIRYIIIHLNDHDHWSRERIADWLESLDADLEFK